MNNAQLNNIIRFSLHFHESMGNKLYEYDPGYILEKWTKYFGELKPNPISDTTHVYLKNYFSNFYLPLPYQTTDHTSTPRTEV